MVTGTQALAFGATAVAVAVTIYRRRRQHGVHYSTSGLVFTGTGCSSGLPLVQCALDQPVQPPNCKSCKVALQRGRGDKNWRGNVGVFLRFVDPKSGATRHVQIDCGKTFREVVTMDVYRSYGIKWLDALLLTHDHADATGGLDELRSLQMYDQKTFEISSSIRCICDRRTLARLRHCFPYLFPKTKKAVAPFDSGNLCQCCEMDLEGVALDAIAKANIADPSGGGAAAAAATSAPAAASAEPPSVKRFVAKIDWESFGATGSDGQPLKQVAEVDVCGLAVTALPLQHGADYVCFGFGPARARTVYLSDYTAILPETEALLTRWSAEGGIELLVLDALRWDESHPVHASALESIEVARRLRPQKTLLVGMGHTMEHEETNRKLRDMLAVEGLDVQLAYDGQFVPVPFF